MDFDSVRKLIADDRLDEAADILGNIADDTTAPAADRAEAYTCLAAQFGKKGDKSSAISYYNRAVGLDASSDAAVALEQARRIMDFYNKDLYNP